MNKDKLVEEYLEYLHEGNLSAAAYAAGKTAHTIAKPLLKLGKAGLKAAGRVALAGGKAIGKAGIAYAKSKLANFRKLGKGPEGAGSALIRGLRGKDA